MDPTGQIPYWEDEEECNPPEEGIVDPDDLRPKVLTALRGRVPAALVNNPAVAARILRPWLADAEVEYETVLYLNVKNKLIGMENVGKGILDSALIHPREIFKGAVRMAAASIITAHNHPSGDPTPSGQDQEVHRRLKEAGKLLGIQLMDSLILGRDSYFYFSEGRTVPYD